jgi:drug/metabolite transporter (DMT)-like permease
VSRPILLGSVMVALAASLFGTLGFVARSADEVGVGALPFVAWRAALATAVLVAVTLLVALRSGVRLPDPRLLSRRQQVALLAACLFGALLNVAMFAAFLRTTIALVLITFYTFPAIVTLAAIRLYGERLDRRRAGALVLSMAGLVLVVLAPALQTGNLDIDLIGVGLALFAALCQSAFILLSGRGYRPFRSLHVATYVVGGALVVSLALVFGLGETAGLMRPLQDTQAWVWLIAGGVVGAAIPTTALLGGMGLIGPSRTAILMTFEPVVGVALAAALLGEQPVPLQLVGGAAVLGAAAILQTTPRAPVPPDTEYPQLI